MKIADRLHIGRKSAPAEPPLMSLDQFLREIAAQGGSTLTDTYRSQLMDGLASNPYVSKCIQLRATSVASLTPMLFDEEGNEVREPRLEALLKRPNPTYHFADLIYEVASDIALTGNGFIEPIRTVKGVSELWYARAGDVTPRTRVDRYAPLEAWQLASNGATAVLAPEELIHIVGSKRGPDGIMGLSPLSSAKLSVVQQTEARRWNVSLMRNGAKPSIVIQSPKMMTNREYEIFSERLNAKHAGTDNAGRTMVLDDGKTISTAGFNARDMDYSVGVTTSAKEIAVALGVPPELVGDSANKTYSNAREANKEFASQTIVPDADRIYNALSWYLCPLYPGVARIGYDSQQIESLRGSEPDIIMALQGAEFMTTNEKRARMSLPPVDGGDEVLASMGRVPLSEVSTPIEGLVGQDDDDQV